MRRLRYQEDMWWSDVSFEDALKWNRFEVSYMDSETCFVKVDGVEMELLRDDYDRIIDKKDFRLKFDLKPMTLK